MKKPLPALAVSALAALVLVGCDSGPSQLACTVTQSADGPVIACPDGSSMSVFNGQNGAAGTVGQQGLRGLGSGIFSSLIPAGDARCSQGNGGFEYTTFLDIFNLGYFREGDTITSVNYLCNGATGAAGADGAMGATGATGETGATGATGATGDTGAAGVAGADGSSSSLSLVAASPQDCPTGGWIVTVTNGNQAPQSVALCNGATGAQGAQGEQGAQGAQGPAGTAGMGLVQLIAPCGPSTSGLREELLLLSDGSLLSDFSDSASGRNTRLTLLSDGSYNTTDGSGCSFTVHTSGGNRTVSWTAGSANHASWTAGGYSWSLPVGPSGAVPLGTSH